MGIERGQGMMGQGLGWFGRRGALLCGFAGVIVVLAPAAASAHAGSAEEQRACTPDVFRLCMAAIPDEDAIVACLKSKKTLLSPACAQVFSDGTGSAPARGRRGQ